MSTSTKIKHNALVVVCDARKALFLANVGDDVFPNLKITEVIEAPANPRTSEQGNERPGRVYHGSRRSAVEQTDWHQKAEQAFARQIADHLDSIHRKDKLQALILVAPPGTMAVLRTTLSKQLQQIVVSEIHKDLTKLPVYEIERHLLS